MRELIGKPLKWQLIPVRLDLETFEALKRIAPEGDVKKLIKETKNQERNTESKRLQSLIHR